jgi:hypothetical protein
MYIFLDIDVDYQSFEVKNKAYFKIDNLINYTQKNGIKKYLIKDNKHFRYLLKKCRDY